MVRHGGALGGLLLLAASMVVGGAPAAAVGEGWPKVDGAVQVTADPSPARAHSVPAVAVDPSDPQVVAIAEADMYSGRCAVHVSTNGGLSWRPTSTPEVSGEWPNCPFVPFGPVVDLVFGPEGTLF